MDDMESSDSEFITQTPNPAESSSLDTKEIDPRDVWGRLFPRVVHLPCVDLIKPCIVIGRSQQCDIVLTNDNFPPRSFRNISKIHFKIERDEDTGSRSAYIMDLSKNGTFVNGTRVECKRILEDDDEISIGTTEKVYIFKSNDNDLPEELRNKYRISRVLGNGACGEVRLAKEKTTEEKVAIKKILKSTLGLQNCLNTPDRIRTEVEILQSLSHPCVISVKEVAETEDAVYIVLEYMEGGELTHLLSDALLEPQAKLIFYQIAIGVKYLHEQGITHRDLKPGNVLLKSNTAYTPVKISDFGLSKIIHNNTLLSTVCGTPSFVAPEIIDPHCSVYTQQVDVWSLGVILYYMLSNELPFKSINNNQKELFHLILSARYSMEQDIWNTVSSDAKDLVKNMLMENPEKRITINDIVRHPWIAQDLFMQQRASGIMGTTLEPCAITKKARLDSYDTE